MKRRLRAYLELVRLPNVFTAMADPLGGFFFVGGDGSRVGVWLALCAVAACLYAAGTALNDVCDEGTDARERPDRPIPSGRISRRAAVRLVSVLLVAGIGIAFSVSKACGLIAALLGFVICLYDGPFKSTRAAAALMGTCRALNLLIGSIAAEPGPVRTLPMLSAAGWMGLYVASVTIFARYETRSGGRRRLIVGTVGTLIASMGVMVLTFLAVPAAYGGRVLATSALAVAGAAGGIAIRTAAAKDIQRAVGLFITNLVLLDASLAATGSGFVTGMLVVSLLVPTIVFGRWFPKT